MQRRTRLVSYRGCIKCFTHSQIGSCDTLVVQLGALLHDIADSTKFHGGDETIGPRTAREFLESQHVAEEVIVHVVQIIENISFKGVKQNASSLLLS